jgi:hypothetical protein
MVYEKDENESNIAEYLDAAKPYSHLSIAHHFLNISFAIKLKLP